MSEEALLEELEAVEAILMEGVEKEISEEVKKVRGTRVNKCFLLFFAGISINISIDISINILKKEIEMANVVVAASVASFVVTSVKLLLSILLLLLL